LHQYERFLQSENDLIVGEGLAIDGASRRLDHAHTVVIDSGIITIYTALGVFIGTLFVCGLIGAMTLTFGADARQSQDMPLYRAIAVATFCQLPFGAVHGGESGFGAWLFIGLAAAAVADRRQLPPLVRLHERLGSGA
jgi:NhaP-type Na+/H+ or K+/H+ antiporter